GGDKGPRHLNLEHGHGEERPEVVVRHAQPGGEQPHDRPKHLVGDGTVEVEQRLEVGPRDGDQGTGSVCDGVRRPLGAIEDRHFAEAGPRLEDSQGLLARSGNGARDPDLALRDDKQAIAGFTFLEDVLPDGEFLLPADFGDAGRLPLVQVLKNRSLLQQLEVHGVEATTRGWEEQVKPWVTWADLLTALRVPLAVAVPFVHHPSWQLGLVGAAAASDFFDGMLARRFGSSSAGAVRAPAADKLFMAAAFVTVAWACRQSGTTGEERRGGEGGGAADRHRWTATEREGEGRDAQRGDDARGTHHRDIARGSGVPSAAGATRERARDATGVVRLRRARGGRSRQHPARTRGHARRGESGDPAPPAPPLRRDRSVSRRQYVCGELRGGLPVHRRRAGRHHVHGRWL